MCSAMALRVFFFASVSPRIAWSLEFADQFLGRGAVLQRGVAAPVWGTSTERIVEISLDGESVATATVDHSRSWSALLPPQVAAFNRTLAIKDATGSKNMVISFGDVLLCAGQSNMDMTVNWPSFHADNGTAECAAAGRYTGGVSLKCMQGRCTDRPMKDLQEANRWFAVTSESLAYFSALCWYTGKALYDQHRGSVPIGLIQGENGGTPIEKFMSNASIATCTAGREVKPCPGHPDMFFYETIVGRLSPYAVGAILWDQAEADRTPTCQHVSLYPCLERQLVETWRAALGGLAVPFLAVQLPGYTDGVFAMRLAQEEGFKHVHGVALLPTYDLSCPHCPKGAVHPTDKQDVARRAVQQLQGLMYDGTAPVAPRATKVTAMPVGSSYEMEITFEGGSQPFALRGTRNCTECCKFAGSDFDASVDGVRWVNGTAASLEGDMVKLTVQLPKAPRILRYTASTVFPQCAVYNAEGLPAFPFQASVSMKSEDGTVFVV